MKLEYSRIIFEKYSNIKFYENCYSDSRVVLWETDGQTHRHDEGNSRFSQFCERAYRLFKVPSCDLNPHLGTV
jgi:hypothetical protein